MSYCKQEGKDTVIFVTKEDHEGPVTKDVISVLDDDPEEEEEGLILANGDINWNCPCLGGMASGPCGMEFREAFSCFHYSEADPKGSDCIDRFREMQECMVQYPELYPSGDKLEEEDQPISGETSDVVESFSETSESPMADGKDL